MSAFGDRLREANPSADDRRWIYVPYDQLTDRIGPLSATEPGEAGIVLIENPAKAAKRPYHRQKLATILANQRQFALEQAERGVAVRYEVVDGDYREALRAVLADVGSLVAMRPAERELREDVCGLDDVEWVDHAGWLTTTEQFEASQNDDAPPWRMDAFYRHVRRETGILMEDGKPVGGKYSHDADNREAWNGDPPAPSPPTFEPDDVTREVGDLIEERFSDHPGKLDLDHLPATADDARRLWHWAKSNCIRHFGPYEDAMSVKSTTLFHTRVSASLHLHRLLPREVVDDVLALDLPVNSKEGFVRQVLGWREFMRHVHDATDGFRTVDGGPSPSFLGADRELPPTFWGDAPSGLRCLDTVVDAVWEEGYGHHITRLMVLANLATLLDVSPRELTDWFWVAYTDAYDWVVEPNVLGMGTFGAGDLFTTKPYVSGAAYIDRMGDYCGDCAFHPKKTCPITPMYWAFLGRHREALDDNPRLRLPLASQAKRPDARRRADRETFVAVASALEKGERLDPPG